MYTLYGIKNCDTVKKARHWLTTHQIEYVFVDFAQTPPTPELLEAWRAVWGQWPLNRQSTTYRQLKSDYEKADHAGQLALLCARPTLLKRPILTGPALLLKGFEPAQWTENLCPLRPETP